MPIRYEDHFLIMKWRNEQIKYLRQVETLTLNEQQKYFSKVIKKQFGEISPNQILMSFFENERIIGYGGLVHIDWESKNAEISFLLDTNLNKQGLYEEKFTLFLELLIDLSKSIDLYKIYTYGYNLKKYRFKSLVKKGFKLEASLIDHKIINNNFYDVFIYSKKL